MVLLPLSALALWAVGFTSAYFIWNESLEGVTETSMAHAMHYPFPVLSVESVASPAAALSSGSGSPLPLTLLPSQLTAKMKSA